MLPIVTNGLSKLLRSRRRRKASKSASQQATTQGRLKLEALEPRHLLAAFTWTGDISSDWGTDGNWAEAGTPGPGDTAIFSDGATTTTVDFGGAQEVDSVQFNHDSSTYTLTGGTLTVNVNVQQDGAGTALLEGNLATTGTIDLNDGTFVATPDSLGDATLNLDGGELILQADPGTSDVRLFDSFEAVAGNPPNNYTYRYDGENRLRFAPNDDRSIEGYVGDWDTNWQRDAGQSGGGANNVRIVPGSLSYDATGYVASPTNGMVNYYEQNDNNNLARSLNIGDSGDVATGTDVYWASVLQHWFDDPENNYGEFVLNFGNPDNIDQSVVFGFQGDDNFFAEASGSGTTVTDDQGDGTYSSGTHLFVVKITVDRSAGAAETIEVWLDPTDVTSEAALGAATSTIDTVDVIGDGDTLTQFRYQANSEDDNGGLRGTFFDELRIADNYQTVFPGTVQNDVNISGNSTIILGPGLERATFGDLTIAADAQFNLLRGELAGSPTLSFNAGLDDGGNWEPDIGPGAQTWTPSGTINYGPIPSQFAAITHAFDLAGGSFEGRDIGALGGSDQDFTFEFWLQPDDLDLTTGQIIFETGGGGDGSSLILLPDPANPGQATLRYTIKDAGASLFAEATISQNTDFTQVVGTYNRDVGGADRLRIYVDGVLGGEDASNNNTNDWDGGNDAGLGGIGQGSVGAVNASGVPGSSTYDSLENFDGKIAIMRYYQNEELTPEQVTGNFRAVRNGVTSETLTTNQTALFENVEVQGGTASINLGNGANVWLPNITEIAATNLNFSSSGVVALPTANTYTGTTTIGSGVTVQVSANDALGTTDGSTTVENGGALRLLGDFDYTTPEQLFLSGRGNSQATAALWAMKEGASFDGDIVANADTEIRAERLLSAFVLNGNIDTNGNEVRFEADSTITVFGVISGFGSIRKEGNATLNLRANNSYTGITDLNNGVIDINLEFGLGTSDGITDIASGGTLRLRGDITIAEQLQVAGIGEGRQGAIRNDDGTNAITGDIQLFGITRIDVDGGTQLELAGVISDDGNPRQLEKFDAGTLLVTNTNTYTGLTTVANGTFIAAADNALGAISGSTLVSEGATLAFSGGVRVEENVTVINGAGEGGQGLIVSLDGDNTLAGNLDVTPVSQGSVQFVSVVDSFTLEGDLDLQFSELSLEGNGDFVFDGNITGVGSAQTFNAIEGRIFFNATSNDGQVDDIGNSGNNGGLLQDNSNQRLLFESPIDYREDDDFRFGDTGLGVEGFPALIDFDHYQSLFVGTLNFPDIEGSGGSFDVEIGTAESDDNVRIYVDLDQDGIFETAAGEQVVTADVEDNIYATVTIPGPGRYDFAVAHNEGGGLSHARPQINFTPGDNSGRQAFDAGDMNVPGFPNHQLFEVTYDANNQVTKTGSGTLTLNGSNNDFNGGLNIQQGRLAGSGTVTASTIDLADGTTVAPGPLSGFGVLDAQGGITQTGTQTYEFSIAGDQAGEHDQLSLFGGLSIDGSLLVVDLDSTNLSDGDTITIMQSDAPITGQFSNPTFDDGTTEYIIAGGFFEIDYGDVDNSVELTYRVLPSFTVDGTAGDDDIYIFNQNDRIVVTVNGNLAFDAANGEVETLQIDPGDGNDRIFIEHDPRFDGRAEGSPTFEMDGDLEILDSLGDDLLTISDEVLLTGTGNFLAEVETTNLTAPSGPFMESQTLDYDAADSTDLTWDGGVAGFEFNLPNSVNLIPADSDRKLSQAYQFNGNGADQSTLQNLPGNPTDDSATWELWFRPDSSNDVDLLFESGASGDGISIVWDGATQEVVFTIDNGSNQRQVRGGTPELAFSEFHHIVAVYTKDALAGDIDILELYINGQSVGQVADTNAINDWAGGDGVQLGNSEGGVAEGTPGSLTDLEGDLAIVRFYETAMTAEEVRQNFETIALAATAPNITTSGSQTYGGDVNVLVDATIEADTLQIDGDVNSNPSNPITRGADFMVDASLDTDGDNRWEDLIGAIGFDFRLDDSPAVNRVTGTSGLPGISAAYNFPGGLTGNEAGVLLSDAGTADNQSFQNAPGDWSNDDVSIEIWFKPDDLTPSASNGQILFEDGGGTGLGFFIDDNQLQLRKQPNDGIISTDISAISSEFIQAVGTYDVSTGAMELFVNGSLVTPATGDNPTADGGDWSGGDPAAVGTRGGANTGGIGGDQSGTESFDGQIAIFRVYNNRLFSEADAQANYNAVVSTPVVNQLTINLTGNGGSSQIDGDVGNVAEFAGLTVDAIDNHLFTLPGVIYGQNTSITKTEDGSLILNGDNILGDSILVLEGRLELNGTNTGGATFTVQADGILGGIGSVDGMVTADAGEIHPGLTSSVGVFSTGPVEFIDGELAIRIQSATDYDQLAVTGSVTITDGFLNFDDSGFSGGDASFYELLLNDGTDSISGEFSGLADGAIVTINGVNYSIDYQFDAATDTINGGNDIALVEVGSISGIKYHDDNDNGTLDSGENVTLENVVIELYLDNGDGTFDPGTDTLLTTDTTDASGQYSFGDLAPGRYFIQEQVPTYFGQTAPTAPDYYEVVIDQIGQAETGWNFLNHNPPPDVDAGGTYTIDEGDPVTFTDVGTGDPLGEPVEYRWDADQDGTPEMTGQSVTYTWSELFALGITDGGNYTIDLEAEDEFGNLVTDTATLIVNDVPAQGLSLVLDTDEINENGEVLLSGSFTNPGGDNSYTVTIDWGDGSTNTVLNLGSNTSFSDVAHIYLDDNPSTTASDDYTIEVTVADENASTNETIDVTVNNVAPTLGSLNATPNPSDEGELVTLTGSFTDSGTLDTFTIDILWGDGNSDQVTITDGSRNFTATHRYADDDPNDSPAVAEEEFTITVTITDDDSGSDSDNTTVQVVRNVDPVVTSIDAPAFAVRGQTVSFDFSFEDAAQVATETFTYEVDWGDGSTLETGTVDPADITFGSGTTPTEGTFTLEHLYTTEGDYTISARVFDDDNGASPTETFDLQVVEVGLIDDPWSDDPNDLALAVGGTNGSDRILINQLRGGPFATVSLNGQSYGSFNVTGEHIFVYGQEGRDIIAVGSSVTMDTYLDGGAGPDQLTGGSGNDVILGGPGDDVLSGGPAGDDILIGGTGSDRLVGGSGRLARGASDQDLLIGDSTVHDSDLQALREIYEVWNSAQSFADRTNQLNASDLDSSSIVEDGDRDILYGLNDTDWFWTTTLDRAMDFGRGDRLN